MKIKTSKARLLQIIEEEYEDTLKEFKINIGNGLDKDLAQLFTRGRVKKAKDADIDQAKIDGLAAQARDGKAVEPEDIDAYPKNKDIIDTLASYGKSARPDVKKKAMDVIRQKSQLAKVSNQGITPQDRKMPQIGADFGPELEAGQTDTDLVTSATDLKAVHIGTLNQELKLDSSVVSQMSVFKGIGPAKFEELKKIADQISKQDFTNYNTRERVLEFSVKANVLNYFANLAKRYGSEAGGYAFEAFCCALLGGINMGGINGAIDVLVADKSKKVGLAATSQKFLTKGGNIKQALGHETSETGSGSKGVYATLREFNEIIYIAAFKSASSGTGSAKESYDKISVAYVKVIQKKRTGEIQHAFLNKNLRGYGSYEKTPLIEKNGKKTHIDISVTEADCAIQEFPILLNPKKSATSVADYVSKQLEAGFGNMQPIMNSIKRVYALLNNLTKNTAEYSAITGGGTTPTGLAPEKYVEQIATDYMAAKEDYKTIFSSHELTGSQAKQAFTENKKLTKALIAKLVMEMLHNEDI